MFSGDMSLIQRWWFPSKLFQKERFTKLFKSVVFTVRQTGPFVFSLCYFFQRSNLKRSSLIIIAVLHYRRLVRRMSFGNCLNLRSLRLQLTKNSNLSSPARKKLHNSSKPPPLFLLQMKSITWLIIHMKKITRFWFVERSAGSSVTPVQKV